MADHQTHKFTRSDIERRFNAIVGRSLGDIDSSGVFQRLGLRNKGIAGAVIEQSVLGYPADSRQEPDIDIDGESWEVKNTGLRFNNHTKELRAKEPMSITAVSIPTISDEEFGLSALWHKLARMLVVYYLYEGDKVPTSAYAAFKVMGWDLHEWSDEQRTIIEADWTLVRDFIRRIKAEYPNEEERKLRWPDISTVLNREMMYLDTSPKYPNPPRFRLKASVVTMMWREIEGKSYEHLPESITSFACFDAKCHELTERFHNMSVAAIADSLGYTGSLASKQVAEALVVRMFGGASKKMSKVALFSAMGLVCKTIAVTESGARTEDTKLFRIDFDEVREADIEWEDSSFRACFAEPQYLFVLFKEPSPASPFADNLFLGFKRFTFDAVAIDEAQRTWEEIRALVRDGTLELVPITDSNGVQRKNSKGNPMNAPNFPKSRDHIVFVRGTGSDSDSKPEVVNGLAMYRQWVWVKGTWITEQLDKMPYL